MRSILTLVGSVVVLCVGVALMIVGSIQIEATLAEVTMWGVGFFLMLMGSFWTAGTLAIVLTSGAFDDPMNLGFCPFLGRNKQ